MLALWRSWWLQHIVLCDRFSLCFPCVALVVPSFFRGQMLAREKARTSNSVTRGNRSHSDRETKWIMVIINLNNVFEEHWILWSFENSHTTSYHANEECSMQIIEKESRSCVGAFHTYCTLTCLAIIENGCSLNAKNWKRNFSRRNSHKFCRKFSCSFDIYISLNGKYSVRTLWPRGLRWNMKQLLEYWAKSVCNVERQAHCVGIPVFFSWKIN